MLWKIFCTFINKNCIIFLSNPVLKNLRSYFFKCVFRNLIYFRLFLRIHIGRDELQYFLLFWKGLCLELQFLLYMHLFYKKIKYFYVIWEFMMHNDKLNWSGWYLYNFIVDSNLLSNDFIYFKMAIPILLMKHSKGITFWYISIMSYYIFLLTSQSDWQQVFKRKILNNFRLSGNLISKNMR